MKCLVTAILVCSAAVLTNAQQPASSRRRGLDQMDLLAVPRSAEPAAASVTVDEETFKLLAPLIGYCKRLESDYTNELINDPSRLGRSFKHERFMKRIGSVYTSISLIEQIQKLPAPAAEIVDRNEAIAEEAARILAILSFGGGEGFKDQIAALNDEFGITRSENTVSDRERLVAAMLRRINTHFARLKFTL